MKLLKPWGAAGDGLLHLTLLLSLGGLRVDPDLCPLLPPPAGRLHSKGREPEPAAPLEGRLLREVRALGVPFVPHTRVDAWLVHSVATGDADGSHVGDGSGQAAPGGGGDPRAAHGSPVAAVDDEKAAAEPASQENEMLRESGAVGLSTQQEEAEKSSEQNGGGEGIKMADMHDWEAEKTVDSRDENHLNWTDASFSLEDFFQLLSSQPEYSLEGISLGGIPPHPGNMSESLNSSHYSINVNQAISHDVNLQEARLLCPNTLRRDPIARTSQAQEPFLHLNSHANLDQVLTAINSTGPLPPVDNQLRTRASQDLLYDFDASIFDEITLMSLVTEGFDSLEVSQLFDEPVSDSGLSLNSSHNYTTTIKTSSSHSAYDGALSYNSDLQSLYPHDLEGAVGGYSPEPSKFCHMGHKDKSGFHEDLARQGIFHNHTYHLHQGVPQPTLECLTEPGKSQKISRHINDTDRNLSRDEQRAKALHIPFSVDEIVCMPVDSFNNMLSRYYLTDLQVSLIRDIRRRGKNKVAAQNCRKRKLDIIVNLEDDVCNLQAKKDALEREQAQYNKAIDTMKQKLHDLYHEVFSQLRDDQGRPVNPNQYTLQCSHNGTVLIVPKELVTSGYKKEAQKRKRENC